MDKNKNKKTVKSVLASALIILCAFCFFSCSGGNDPIIWRDKPFYAKIEYTVGELKYSAEVYASGTDERGEREYSLLYSAPQSLSGISVRVKGAQAGIICRGLEVPVSLEAGERMCAAVKLLCAQGLAASKTEKGEYNGVPCKKARLSGEGHAVFYISSEHGLPLYALAQYKEFDIEVKIHEIKIGTGTG